MQYFKDKIGSTGVLFLQETHSNSRVEQKWKEDLEGPFFSHGKSNSCGVLIAYFGTGTFIVKKKQTDNEGRILILDVSINDSEYILINLYNANTENEQINVLSSPTKPLVMTGDFNLFFNSELEAQGGNPILKIKNLQLNLLNLKRLMIYVIYRGGGG